MKLRSSLSLAILCSCLSCDREVQPASAYHITYGFSQTLSSPTGIISIGNLTIMTINPAADRTPALVCVNEFGDIQWSKSIMIPAENGFTVASLNRVDDNTFSVAGNLGTGYPIIIQFNIDGTVVSSRKYITNPGLAIYKCSTNSDGATVCGGYFSENNNFHGFAFKESKAGNIDWAVDYPGAFSIEGLTDQSGTNTFLFPAFGSTHESQTVIKLDNDGNLVKSKELLRSADLFLEKVVRVGEDFFLAYTEWDTGIVYLIKVNSEGQFVKGMKFVDSENPEMDADNSSVFLSLTVLGDLNIVELDSDLGIKNRKTVVNLIGGDNSTLYGHVEVSDGAISCIIEPFSLDPTYGNKALNAIRFLKEDWKTRCTITQSNLTTLSTSFQTNPGTSIVNAIDIDQEDLTPMIHDLVLNQTKICK